MSRFNNFFSSESFAMRFLTTLCNLMYINLLFLICCIPIITIGPALTAMYSTIFKCLRGEDPTITKVFFSALKNNFKQSFKIWLPLLFFILGLSASIYWTINVLDESYKYILYPSSIALFLLFCIMMYLFPQIAVFEQTTQIVFKNSCLLAISNMPTTIMMVVIPVIIYLIAGLSPKAYVMVISIMLFFGTALVAYIYSFFLKNIFNKIIGDKNDNV